MMLAQGLGPRREPGQRRLIVFSRVPRSGEVKTRLARTIGDRAALALHRELLARTLNTAQQAGADSLELCIDGNDFEGECAALAAGSSATLTHQCGGSLGERMREALGRALEVGASPVLIGSDIPSLSPQDLGDAIGVLQLHDAVFAPAEDGGYALVGCRRPIDRAIRGIAWGSTAVMDATRQALRSAGIGWHELRTLWDVDDADSLARWRALQLCEQSAESKNR
jgi:rSAM/selenodomain-associated transferase 1